MNGLKEEEHQRKFDTVDGKHQKRIGTTRERPPHLQPSMGDEGKIEVDHDRDPIVKQVQNYPAVTRNRCVLRGLVSPRPPPEPPDPDRDPHTTAEKALAAAKRAVMVAARHIQTRSVSAQKETEVPGPPERYC